MQLTISNNSLLLIRVFVKNAESFIRGSESLDSKTLYSIWENECGSNSVDTYGCFYIDHNLTLPGQAGRD